LKEDTLLNYSKKDLHILCSILTGHCKLNKHLTVMKLSNDPICPACLEEEETASHVMLECPAFASLRGEILGDSLSTISVLDHAKLLSFAKRTRRFMREPETT